MFELKHISPAAIPRALAKAERYRLLNEPSEAESICLDVLLTDPENQQALVTLLLALTDGFGESPGVDVSRAHRSCLPRLREPYERHYYAGHHPRALGPRTCWPRPCRVHVSLGWIREAMREYEKAVAISPAGQRGRDPALERLRAAVRARRAASSRAKPR